MIKDRKSPNAINHWLLVDVHLTCKGRMKYDCGSLKAKVFLVTSTGVTDYIWQVIAIRVKLLSVIKIMASQD